MRWEAWVLVSLEALALLTTVLTIGQPRQPTTPRQAALALILGSITVWLIWRLAVAAC